MHRLWIIGVLATATASASPVAPEDATPQPAAPEDATPRPPVLAGRVGDSAGRPIEGATVFVASKPRAITDANGRYHVELAEAGTYAVVFEYGGVRDGHKVVVKSEGANEVDGTLTFERGEVIEIHEPLKPPVRAKPLKDPKILPPYSDEAILSDAWEKAWLVLDVDETGAVTRVKFLARPHHNLDSIAVSQALSTKFEPARDAHDRPTRSLVIWPIEWPSYWWMHDLTGLVMRMPDKAMDGFDTSGVPCRGAGPLNLDSIHPTYRDCTTPDLSKINSAEPWIDAKASDHR